MVNNWQDILHEMYIGNDIADKMRENTTHRTNLLSKVRLVPFAQKFNSALRFPDLRRGLIIKRNNHEGRFIKATQDIPVGKKLGEATAFAAVIDGTDTPYCLTCFKTRTAKELKIFCIKCRNVVFCSTECRTADTTHKFVCGSNFHAIQFGNHLRVKCAIQMVLKSIAIHDDDVSQLKTAAEGMSNNGIIERTIPTNINSEASRFDTIMRLEGSRYESFETDILLAVHVIQETTKLYNKQEPHHKIFLVRLLEHFLMILNRNSFEVPIKVNDNNVVNRVLIFDTFSLFNHSCSPEALHIIEQNQMTLIASIPIAKNTKVCISYEKLNPVLSTEDRRYALNNFGFECKCIRCTHFDNYGEEISADNLNAARLTTSSVGVRNLETSLERRQEELGAFEWDIHLGELILKYDKVVAARADP